jgi:hypothetical protein
MERSVEDRNGAHAALAFYYDNRDEIEAELEADQGREAEHEGELEATRPGTSCRVSGSSALADLAAIFPGERFPGAALILPARAHLALVQTVPPTGGRSRGMSANCSSV